MAVILKSPGNFELLHGASPFVRRFLDALQERLDELHISPVIDSIRFVPLLAPKEEMEAGKFQEFLWVDWKLKMVAIGVNGDYPRYLQGDDFEKINVLCDMLTEAFIRLSQKKKAKIDATLPIQCIRSVRASFCKTPD